MKKEDHCNHCSCYDSHGLACCFCNLIKIETDSSAPLRMTEVELAKRLYDTMPDMIHAILEENELEPRLYSQRWAQAIMHEIVK